MAATLGTATVKIVPELSSVFAIVIAAVRLYDALYYGNKDVLLALPDAVASAYGDLRTAIEGNP